MCLGARGSNVELGVEAKQKTPALWRLQAGNGRSRRSSWQVDQGHLQNKVSYCFFLPQPPYPTSADSDPSALGRTFSSQWSHILPRFFTP